MGCPLLIGVGDDEAFVASDVSAVVAQTRRVIYLDEGDVAEVKRDGVRVFDADGAAVQRKEQVSGVSLASLELGPYRHFMQKEIHEQPRAIADTLEPIGTRRGFIRAVVRLASEFVLYLGYLWMIWDPKRQTWHDKAVKSIVVKR